MTTYISTHNLACTKQTGEEYCLKYGSLLVNYSFAQNTITNNKYKLAILKLKGFYLRWTVNNTYPTNYERFTVRISQIKPFFYFSEKQFGMQKEETFPNTPDKAVSRAFALKNIKNNEPKMN